MSLTYTLKKILINIQNLETTLICKLGKKFVNKFTKLSKIGFSMERFTANFLQFFQKMPKFDFWVDDWELSIKFKHFRDFFDFS